MPGDKAPDGENVTGGADGKVYGVETGKEVDPKSVEHTEPQFTGDDPSSSSSETDGDCVMM